MSTIEKQTEIHDVIEAKQHHTRKARMHKWRYLHHLEKVKEATERLNVLAEALRAGVDPRKGDGAQ
jgi:hypothetical protein